MPNKNIISHKSRIPLMGNNADKIASFLSGFWSSTFGPTPSFWFLHNETTDIITSWSTASATQIDASYPGIYYFRNDIGSYTQTTFVVHQWQITSLMSGYNSNTASNTQVSIETYTNAIAGSTPLGNNYFYANYEKVTNMVSGFGFTVSQARNTYKEVYYNDSFVPGSLAYYPMPNLTVYDTSFSGTITYSFYTSSIATQSYVDSSIAYKTNSQVPGYTFSAYKPPNKAWVYPYKTTTDGYPASVLEAIIYYGTMSVADRNQVTTYLKNKWSIF